MEKIYINYDEELKTFFRPQFSGDAGYDLAAFSEPEIKGNQLDENIWSSIDYIEYDTNVSLSPSNDSVFCYVFPRSSLSKYNLFFANSVGVIDSGYRNSIKVRFKYCYQPSDIVKVKTKFGVFVDKEKIYKKGDRIAQMIFSYHVKPDLEYSKHLLPSDRGMGGFGHTGV